MNSENLTENVTAQDLRIRAEKINLRSCNLDFVTKEKQPKDDLFYEMSVAVFRQILASELFVIVVNHGPENSELVQLLSFRLVGIFTADDGITKEQIANFGEMFSFSILWPYAREFAQNMFQKTGFTAECLPILNTQEVTKELIENGKIKVNFLNNDEI